MTKREIWNSLDAGWRRAMCKTMRRWMNHVECGGYWTYGLAGCPLCARDREVGGLCDGTCPLTKERKEGCCGVKSYCEWGAKAAAYRDGVTKRKPLPEAKAVLHYLCGFPPPSDRTRQAAEKLLTRRKAG